MARTGPYRRCWTIVHTSAGSRAESERPWIIHAESQMCAGSRAESQTRWVTCRIRNMLGHVCRICFLWFLGRCFWLRQPEKCSRVESSPLWTSCLSLNPLTPFLSFLPLPFRLLFCCLPPLYWGLPHSPKLLFAHLVTWDRLAFPWDGWNLPPAEQASGDICSPGQLSYMVCSEGLPGASVEFTSVLQGSGQQGGKQTCFVGAGINFDHGTHI